MFVSKTVNGHLNDTYRRIGREVTKSTNKVQSFGIF